MKHPRRRLRRDDQAHRPRCRCGQLMVGKVCWDCQSNAMAETLYGNAVLIGWSLGLPVLECWERAEELMAGTPWHTETLYWKYRSRHWRL